MRNKKINLLVRLKSGQKKLPRGQKGPSTVNDGSLKKAAPRPGLMAQPDVMRKAVSLLSTIPEALGGATITQAADDGVQVEVAPLSLEAAQVMVSMLPGLVQAQQATGTTPGVLNELLGQEGAMVQVYRDAVQLGDTVVYNQTLLANLVRGQEQAVDDVVQRLLKTLPPNQRRTLLSDYGEVLDKQEALSQARATQTGKTKKDIAEKASDLMDLSAHGQLLNTMVDLKDEVPVSDAQVLAAAATSYKEAAAANAASPAAEGRGQKR
jgi:hypothetical protein